jgi:aryl-alcohol dehydrogenase-like predicted oxidoreductase
MTVPAPASRARAWLPRAQCVRKLRCPPQFPRAAALHFTLGHPAVTAAVVGARSPGEISADVGYLAAPVPDALFDELAAEGLIAAAMP